MNREEVIDFMIASINADNREICQRGSMPEEQIEKSIEESQPSLYFIVGNLYDKLKEVSVIS
jgi:hypothetical protein